jgi:hypothetical protein
LKAKHGNQLGRTDSSNEDFADWFAVKVAKDLGTRGISTKNLGCALLGGDGVSYGTINGLTMKWSTGYNDNHSPSLYRLLGIETELGQSLAPVCSEVIKKSSSSYSVFSKCV